MTAPPTTLLATERGSSLNNLGGSDPRRRRRWAAESRQKWGPYRPKIGPLRDRHRQPVAAYLLHSSLFCLPRSEIWPQSQTKIRFGTYWVPRSILFSCL